MQETATRTLAGHAERGRRAVALLRHPLYTNAFFLWLSQGVMALSGLVFWTLAARLYTTSQVGHASAALSAMTLLGTLSSLGIGMGLIRLLPSAGDEQAHLINVAFTIAAATGTLAALIFLVGLPLWAPGLSYLTHSIAYAALFIVYTAAATVAAVSPLVFIAFRGARYVLLKVALAQAARLAFPVGLVTLGAFGIVSASGLSSIVVVVVGLALMPSVVRGHRPALAFSRESAAIVPFGLTNHAADLALMAPGLVLPLLTLEVLGATSAAHLYVGFFLGAQLLAVLQSLATSLFAEGSNGAHALEHTARHVAGYAVAFSAASFIALWLIGGRLLALFGDSYAGEATGLLRLVALAAIPASLTYVYLAIQRVRRNVKRMLQVSWATSVVTLIVGPLLLPRVGIVGAGIGVLCGQCVGALVCGVHLLKATRVPGLPDIRPEPEWID